MKRWVIYGTLEQTQIGSKIFQIFSKNLLHPKILFRSSRQPPRHHLVSLTIHSFFYIDKCIFVCEKTLFFIKS